ncbi:hypothetical protein BpHYR1_034574 [Brachionus plicatilis]|uniref:Uncharacterized protein n=1 Tax=Brachionus plicatilis TaxID=10195 RepID=A0A3M7R832_BRAPC|nr:hypothetical protein BpHYR1_034574 [Brachionus plicatilis]
MLSENKKSHLPSFYDENLIFFLNEHKTKLQLKLEKSLLNIDLIEDNEYYREENRLLSTSYDDLTKKYIKGNFKKILKNFSNCRAHPNCQYFYPTVY